MKLNSKQTEEVAKNCLTGYYIKCGNRITINCDSNDKTPAYDGFITLYDENEENIELSKSHYRLRIPIQLKGINVDSFKYKNFKYPVSIDDLNIYSKDMNGVLFLVVQICNNDCRLFYNILSPYKIFKILEKYNLQKTVNLEFIYVGDDKARLINICDKFEEQVKKEKKAQFISLKDIKDTYPIEFTTPSFYVSEILKRIKSFDIACFLNKDGHQYIIEDFDTIYKIAQHDHKNVFLNDELLWDHVIKEVTDDGKYTLYLGDNVSLDLTSNKINDDNLIPVPVKYNLNSKLSEDVKTIKFLNYIENNKTINCFEKYGDIYFRGECKTFLNKSLEGQYKSLIKIQALLKGLNIDYDLDFRTINKKQKDVLNYIATVYDTKKGDIKTGVYYFNIGDKKIYCSIYKINEKVIIKNAFEKDDNFRIFISKNNKEIDITPVVLIRDDLDSIINFNLEFYNNSLINLIENNCFDEVDMLVLSLIQAYDNSKISQFLESAEMMYNKMINTRLCRDYEINCKINLMQCYIRKRKLSLEELNELRSIYNNLSNEDDDIIRKFCIDVLLGNSGNAKIIYEGLNIEIKEVIKKLPIYNLYNL